MAAMLKVVLWSVCFGFVTAGIISNCYRAVTTRPISFRLLFEGGGTGMLLALPLLAISGPAVIARNAWRGRVIEGRAWGWLAASFFLVSLWSFLIGLYVVDFLVKLVLVFGA